MQYVGSRDSAPHANGFADLEVLLLSDGATSVVIVVTTTSLRLELTWQPAVLLQPGEHNSYLRWAEWGSDCIRRSDTMYELEFQLPIN
ncbi:hypothetical protein ABH37_01795 [Mycobacterium haemophilum]|uniref:Uncharacterized protein n=1 Tax=Mycobacterium haemophilum TaxID=29311 RepID=A0A0I9UA22_9MYCO|nr:hypothetical protein ABH39_01790 [Mycobacterium haemophilum]KLO39106.1 hypothetical protein ABH38_01790 [Mycobacterium haemophilum]KLO45520.1 hypothetical protein ABH37_01795 [Mycobacterium haemophilum]KLO56671.1 hypothetical protein ABH36_01785 [Mycobacterium haemophilum]